jgi:P4 family phage/plasmid primase-like protien
MPDDVQEVLSALRLTCAPDTVHELRVINMPECKPVPMVGGVRLYGRRWCGYYSDLRTMAEHAAAFSRHGAQAVYFTPNPVAPELRARANNGITKAKSGLSTHDGQVARRHWFLVDIDPVRPTGISATDEELALAEEKAREVRAYLGEQGWPDPVVAVSGNGAHLMWRVDEPNDDETRALFSAAIDALAERFDVPDVAVDKTVHSAAQLWKVYGTWARKGDEFEGRIYRKAGIVDAPGVRFDDVHVVPRTKVEALIPTEPAKPRRSTQTSDSSSFDLEDFMRTHFPQAEPKSWKGTGTKWVLDVCPVMPEHNDRSACVTQQPTGEIAAGCHHNSCTWNWHDLRARYAPKVTSDRRGDGGWARHLDDVDSSEGEADKEPAPAAPGETLSHVTGTSHTALSQGLQAEIGENLTAVSGLLYQYDGAGVWEHRDVPFASRIMQTWDGCFPPHEDAKAFRINTQDVRGAYEMLAARVQADDFWDGEAIGLAFAEQSLVLAGRTITPTPHNPDHRFRYAYPWKWSDVERAECPQWEAQTLRVCNNDPEVAKMLQMYAGASLLGLATELQCVLLLHGPGNNGKSSWVETLKKAFPPGAVDVASPHALGERFGAAVLDGTRLCIHPDMPKTPINDRAAGRFKAAVVGDSIDIEEKHRQPYSIKPRAGWIMSANLLPDVKDDSDGFWRRIRLVPTGKALAAAEIDRLFPQKLALEMKGIVRWLVDGAREVIAADSDLPVPAAVEYATNRWRDANAWNPDANTLQDAVGTRIEIRKEGDPTVEWIEPTDVYEALFPMIPSFTQKQMNRATAAMHDIGWVKARLRVTLPNGTKKQKRVYRRPE